jgi:hypothetical protein
MPMRTYTHTSTTSIPGNWALRPSRLRLSYVIQNPSSGVTQYLVNNASDTTSDGAILNTSDKMSARWDVDGYEVVNKAVGFIVASGTGDLKITETLARDLETFKKITGIER